VVVLGTDIGFYRSLSYGLEIRDDKTIIHRRKYLTVCSPKNSFPDFKFFGWNAVHSWEHMETKINEHIEGIARI
jgi:hypothetical protein